MRENTNGRLLQGKGLQIQINNKTMIEFGLCYLPQPSALADNTNLCLNNSSYPTRTEFNNCLINSNTEYEVYE